MQHPLKVEKTENDSYIKIINRNNVDCDVNINENHEFLLDFINSNNENHKEDLSNVSPTSSLTDFGRYGYSPKSLNDSYIHFDKQEHLPILTTHNSNTTNNNIKSMNDICSISNPVVSTLPNNICDDYSGRLLINTGQNPVAIPIIPTCDNSFVQYPTNIVFASQASLQNLGPMQQILQYQQDSMETNSNSKNCNRKCDDDTIKKLEKKRERNREAARKCRERKMHHIEELQFNLIQKENSYKNLKDKMKLAVAEIVRLGEYITANIPNNGIKSAHEFIKELNIDKILNEEDYN